jgi:hypothetical protein
MVKFIVILFMILIGCNNNVDSKKTTSKSNKVEKIPKLKKTKVKVDHFSEMINKFNLLYTKPEDFKILPLVKNKFWNHYLAIESPTQDLEVRYGEIPKELIKNNFRKCNSNLDCFNMLKDVANSWGTKLGKDKKFKYGPFPPGGVREEFYANQGGTLAFQPNIGLTKYKFAMVIIIYKKGKFATQMILYDNNQILNKYWKSFFHSIKFKNPIVKQNSFGKGIKNTFWSCETFINIKFKDSTWFVIHRSAAGAVMGMNAIYSNESYEIKYNSDSTFDAKVFRIRNMERGELTPKNPKWYKYSYTLKDKSLVIENKKLKMNWKCKLLK